MPITQVEKEGQRYVDEPVYVEPRVDKNFILQASIAAIFSKQPMHFELPKPILVGHNRVRLRWMEPDGKGGLKPRGTRK